MYMFKFPKWRLNSWNKEHLPLPPLKEYDNVNKIKMYFFLTEQS